MLKLDNNFRELKDKLGKTIILRPEDIDNSINSEEDLEKIKKNHSNNKNKRNSINKKIREINELKSKFSVLESDNLTNKLLMEKLLFKDEEEKNIKKINKNKNQFRK